MARTASGVMAAAAILSMHCHSGVIDPSPPPPEECVNVPDPFEVSYATPVHTRDIITVQAL